MKIGIVGMGLIGGSIGLALKKYTEHEVFGFDVDDETVKAMVGYSCDFMIDEQNLGELDALIIALKEASSISALEKYAPYLKDGAVVFDTCGNKRRVVACMENLKKSLPALHFAGVHPMAGREFSGLKAARAELFRGAYILAVEVENDEVAIKTVEDIFLSIKAKRLEVCTAKRHDEMIAYTSQLAHVLSSSYVKNPLALEHIGYSAGSFLDLTRVAKLDAAMWTELFLNNKDNLVLDIDRLISELKNYRDAIKNDNSEELYRLLDEGSRLKQKTLGVKNDD